MIMKMNNKMAVNEYFGDAIDGEITKQQRYIITREIANSCGFTNKKCN